MNVIVVGAGLAGLACARALARAQVETVVLEASDAVGGRVRTDEIDGYRVDRGFQVLFTEYPAFKKLVDPADLSLKRYSPGALVAQGNRRSVVADPFRDPESALGSILSQIIPLADKLRTWHLCAELARRPDDFFWDGPDQTALRFLKLRGFSPQFIENFARPFFGGIFLDRTLGVSAQLFQFYWKMLVLGDTATPALGMGELPRSLATGLDIRLETPVESLLRNDNRVHGVRLRSGEELRSEAVVVAVDPPELDRLTGLSIDRPSVGTTTLWVSTPEPLVTGKKIVLHANQLPFVQHLVPISNVSPDLAPSGKHLTALCLPSAVPSDTKQVLALAIEDLGRMFRGDRQALALLDAIGCVAIHRTPHAQLGQPPGFRSRLLPVDPGIAGLRITGEVTDTASIDGALGSGISAAHSLIGTGTFADAHPIPPTG